MRGREWDFASITLVVIIIWIVCATAIAISVTP